MSEDQWQAPGRERSTPGGGAGRPFDDDGARGPYVPGAERPHAPYSPSADAFATSDRHRERVLGGQGYDTPAYRNDSVAVAAMVLGVVGVAIPGVCLLAVAFGHLALRRLRTSYEGGRGLAVAALVLGYVMSAIWLAVLLLSLTGRSLA